MRSPMKFTSVEVRGGLITANVELEPTVDGGSEMALGRAVAEKLSYFTVRGHVRVIAGQSGISIQAEVVGNDFESLQDAAAIEQGRFVELIREAKHLRSMLSVIQWANGFNRNGLPKSSDDEKR